MEVLGSSYETPTITPDATRGLAQKIEFEGGATDGLA